MAEYKTLYHISKNKVGLMTPRIPASEFEDQTTPRICFATSIQGCLIGANEDKDIRGEVFHVYTIETDDYYIPSESEVADVKVTGEVWIKYAVEPDYLYDIRVEKAVSYSIAEIAGNIVDVPHWKYTILNPVQEDLSEHSKEAMKLKGALKEDTRSALINKSKGVGLYKDTSRGRNRFERKKYSKIANQVKSYNQIDMNDFFKRDILKVKIPVIGETDNYDVTIKMEGIVAEIAKNIKSNHNKLEYRTIIQSLTKVFNTTNIYTKCTCPDYNVNYSHWNIVNNVSVDDTSQDPGPGKGIRNPRDDKGRGCKHILLVLSNQDFLMKVASCIKNYIHYMEENMSTAFLKVIFPKLYGVTADEMVEKDIIDDEIYLDSSKGLIDAINAYGAKRGQYKPGSNKNLAAEKEKIKQSQLLAKNMENNKES